jgi:hypothetical protein
MGMQLKLLGSAGAGAMLTLLAGTALLPEAQGAAAPARAPHQSLCARGEAEIYQCRIGGQFVAVCGGQANGRTYAQYRHGTPGHLDLVYPATTGDGAGSFTYARTGYSGGGELQIRFLNQGVEYILYSSTIRTGFGNHPNNPAFIDGLIVRHDGHTLSSRRCSGESIGDAEVERYMPEGAFVEHD